MSNARSMTAGEKAIADTVLRLALGVVVVGQAAAGRSDTDIWGHMAIGLDMLAGRRFLWVDPYSFTHDQSWINHEWLWDLVTASAYQLGGLPLLLLLRAALIALVLWLVDRSTRGAPTWVRVGALCLTAVGCAGQWRSTRPQIATLTLYAVLLSNISAWWVPALFLLWANTHGGWIFGLGAVLFHSAVRRSRRNALIATASAVATLVNPYGVHLWTSLADALSRGWADVSEWQPVWRLAAGEDALLLWVGVAAAAAYGWQHSDRRLWPTGWTIVALAAAANSRRLTALAAITVALLLVRGWVPLQAQVPLTWTRRRRVVAAVALAAAAAIGLAQVWPSMHCFPPMREWTNAPEPEAVAFVRANGVRRLLPHFDFGEYAIFHLRGQAQVAMDNRRETVYSDRVVQENQRFADGLDPDYPDRIGADAVWWPVSDQRALIGLEERGWHQRFVGPRTVVLTKADGPAVHARPVTTASPCFPQP